MKYVTDNANDEAAAAGGGVGDSVTIEFQRKECCHELCGIRMS